MDIAHTFQFVLPINLSSTAFPNIENEFYLSFYLFKIFKSNIVYPNLSQTQKKIKEKVLNKKIIGWKMTPILKKKNSKKSLAHLIKIKFTMATYIFIYMDKIKNNLLAQKS